jgi:ribonuclease HI
MVKLFVDGGPKKGAWVMTDDIGGYMAHDEMTLEGVLTSNEGEYEALWLALKKLLPGVKGPFLVYLDSKLVVNQLSDAWRINKPTLRQRAIEIWALIVKHPEAIVRFKWIRRNKNFAGLLLEGKGLSKLFPKIAGLDAG